MKPFVAIDGVLDYLLFIFFRCISVEDCAKSEIAVSAYGPVRGPGMTTGSYAETAISDFVTISVQNAHPSCRWSSIALF